MENLSEDTKLAILEKHATAEINDIIDTNYQANQLFLIKSHLKGYSNIYTEETLLKINNILQTYENKCEEVKLGKL